MAIRYLTCALASSLLAEGVRVANWTGELQKNIVARPRPRMEKSREIPWIDWFASEWNEFAQQDNHSRPPGPLPRVVVGVFSTLNPSDDQYRRVIRHTWMRSPLVCTLADHENGTESTGDCSFFVTFVVGNSSYNPRDGVDRDVTVLPMHENMNNGKTRLWFEFAAGKYTWATHIAKMDMDVYVFTHKVVELLLDHKPACPNVFGGVAYSCWASKPFCPPVACSQKHYPERDVDYDFLAVDPGTDRRCWHYMQGAFYFLSRDFAARVAGSSEEWRERDRHGWPEDSSTGFAVNSYGHEKRCCVAGINLHGDQQGRLDHKR